MKLRQGFADKRLQIGVAGMVHSALLLLAGCEVGPRYARPSVPAPPAYKELPPDWTTAQPSDAIARGKWWEIFQDAKLNGLEEQINVSNQNLKAAEAQYIQARALVRQNRADYFPTITDRAVRDSGSSIAESSALQPVDHHVHRHFAAGQRVL